MIKNKNDGSRLIFSYGSQITLISCLFLYSMSYYKQHQTQRGLKVSYSPKFQGILLIYPVFFISKTVYPSYACFVQLRKFNLAKNKLCMFNPLDSNLNILKELLKPKG